MKEIRIFHHNKIISNKYLEYTNGKSLSSQSKRTYYSYILEIVRGRDQIHKFKEDQQHELSGIVASTPIRKAVEGSWAPLLPVEPASSRPGQRRSSNRPGPRNPSGRHFSDRRMKDDFFFNFLHFFKLILNLTLFYFFSKINTFGRAYCHGATKLLCSAMHGGAAGG